MNSINEIDTPAVLIDLDKLDSNLKGMASRMSKSEVNLRPHIKTHKSQYIAKEQVKNGAVGVTVATLGEAEVMVEAGIKDILIAYPIIGDIKLTRLKALMNKCKIIVSVDSFEAAYGLSELGKSIGKTISLYIDVDTGLNRCGKAPGDETLHLVKEINPLPNVKILGLMTHAGHAYAQKNINEVQGIAKQEADSLIKTKDLLKKHGIAIPEISVGSTPTAHFIADQSRVTEARPGAYVFGDRSQYALGLINKEQCAMTVLTTVVSTPRPGVAIIDAGSKTFSSDQNKRFPGYGEWTENSEVYVERLSEEHGILHVPEGVELNIGQVLAFIPNHCCTVTNLHDQLYGVRKKNIEKMITVDARGKTK